MLQSLNSTVACTVIGGAVMGAGMYSGLTSERLTKRGRLGHGVVTNITLDSTSGNSHCFAIEFRYEDQEGVEHIIRPIEESSIVTLEIGQKVRVLYDPANPELAKIDTFGQMWLIAIIMSLFGAVFFVIGAVSWWQIWKQP